MSFKHREILEPKEQGSSFLIECHFSSFSPVLCSCDWSSNVTSNLLLGIFFWCEKIKSLTV